MSAAPGGHVGDARRWTRRAALAAAVGALAAGARRPGGPAGAATAGTPAAATPGPVVPPQSVNPFDQLEMPGAFAVAMTIRNAGTTPDRLVAASSPVAREVQLHRIVGHGEARRMVLTEDGIPIPPGTTTLGHDDDHPMLVGILRQLNQGDEFPLTLRFAGAGETTVAVRVRRRLDAAGLPPQPPVALGPLTILSPSTVPAPKERATPAAQATPTA